ncbi:Xaa-Pro peptidase family protein, partial [Patescibacteria group bacterium]|nr:Xaa-Pro peptidase family protein [Patescibacteria group bacterium]
ERIKRLQQELNKKNVQSLLVSSKENLRYFAGFVGSKGYLLITKKKAVFLTDFRYIESAKKLAPKDIQVVEVEKKLSNFKTILNKYKIKEMGFEDNELSVLQFKSLKKLAKGVKFRPTYPLLQQIREGKNKAEFKTLAESQKLNEKILQTVIKKFVRVGVAEEAVAWELEKTARELGAEKMAFPSIVAFGKNSSMPHHDPGRTKLKKGNIILVDMGVVYKGYHSDMSRTFFTASPTPEQEKIYNLVLQAQEETIAKLKPGITGKKVDSVARKLIEKHGFGENFKHATGHGVGFEIHELPSFHELYKKKIQEGAVVTVEPGIYLENKYGVRIEDMVIIEHCGNRNITRFPKDIKNVIIKV